VRQDRDPRHRHPHVADSFSDTFTALGTLAYEGATVSASIIDVATGKALVAIDDRIVLPTASIGKILLLIEVSAQLTASERGARPLAAHEILDKVTDVAPSGAGVWQHLLAPALPVADLAALVGATSDNLATNTLLKRIGLEAVRTRTESLGLRRSALLDLVRDIRGPDDAPRLSVGAADELSWLMGALFRGEIVDAATSERVVGWLALGPDLSLVASAFGLDPLAHTRSDHGMLLVNKTGTDGGVRAEIGVLRGPGATVAYAVVVQFADDALSDRLRVIEALRAVGLDILEFTNRAPVRELS
jgi:beta-lactamase class A